MTDPSRRKDERFPCSFHAFLLSAAGARICELGVEDLGMGGAALASPLPLERGVRYQLELKRGLVFPGRLAWEAKPKGEVRHYGLQFVLTTTQEAKLRKLVDDLRQGLWAGR
jgi:hypothetical protein